MVKMTLPCLYHRDRTLVRLLSAMRRSTVSR